MRRIARKLRKRFANRIAAVYAFGSRVRGDHDAWSDFDVLVAVRDREPHIEEEIVGIFVEEELRTGLQVTPLVKDARAFDREKALHTPFYRNLMAEGVSL
ncbi:MAG: nucleotidyltransferase domain-containing protein [Nitrospirae bacterium]|nr:nucleotidyltransferase domain-containing protein [Nitrospirota bacterium]